MNPHQSDKLTLRKALMDLFWIATLLPLPIVGVAKAIGVLARL